MHVNAAAPTPGPTTQLTDPATLTVTDLKLRNAALSELLAMQMQVTQRLMLSLDDMQGRICGMIAVGYVPLSVALDGGVGLS